MLQDLRALADVYSVGINGTDPTFLDYVSSGEHWFELDTWDQLDLFHNTLLELLCDINSTWTSDLTGMVSRPT